MANFVTPDNVRDYLGADEGAGQWSDAVIGSNINAASGNLQRWTRRQFTPEGSNSTVTKRFSTLGRSYLVIPDVRSVSQVRLNGAALTENESFWLTPDRHQTGVFVGIELPRRRSLRYSRDWFDRNYDSPYFSDLQDRPNDLEIDGVWGHDPYPSELLHAATVLAAYYTKRPDAVLGGVSTTTQGNEVDLSQLPREVADFVRDWKLGDAVVSF